MRGGSMSGEIKWSDQDHEWEYILQQQATCEHEYASSDIADEQCKKCGHCVIRLSQADMEHFLGVLENPPAPCQKLIDLFKDNHGNR